MSDKVASLVNVIKNKHKAFLDSVGKIPYRVSDDYHLLLIMTSSKISLILSLLKETEVIDNYDTCNMGENIKYTLSKKGLDFRVEILTNGTIILMRSGSSNLDDDNLFVSRQTYRPLKNKGWDWEDFTSELLSFIHFTMYKSQKAEEINVKELMGDKKNDW